MTSLKIPLMCGLVVIIIAASFRSSGPEIRFLYSDEVTEMPDDFFANDTECLVEGDTIEVLVNPYRYIGPDWRYGLMGKSKVAPLTFTWDSSDDECEDGVKVPVVFLGSYSSQSVYDPVATAVIVKKN